jgi:alkylation response protein AidB-like acyl-CoA dehydrogenase
MQSMINQLISQNVNSATEQVNGAGEKLFNAIVKRAQDFRDNGKLADSQQKISSENYRILKQLKFFSALVPEQFGGQNVSFSQMCGVLVQLAKLHPSTALSCSMHQHIVAATRYNSINGRPGQVLLEKVLANELVLISTGAGDWLASSGEMQKVDGGFCLNATKHFASGSTEGDLLMTSAPFNHSEHGWQVLHFPVSMSTDGVNILDNWQPMGMKGTGSNSVELNNVFVAEEAVGMSRPRGDFHSVYNVVLPIASAMIMSVYVGIAELACERALQRVKASDDPVTPYLLGEMQNALTTAQVILKDMVSMVDEFNFETSLSLVNMSVTRKTLVANACTQVVEKAVEVCGGPGYLEFAGIECLLRDVRASSFHPLQEKRQLLFSGSLAMGKQPPSQAF